MRGRAWIKLAESAEKAESCAKDPFKYFDLSSLDGSVRSPSFFIA